MSRATGDASTALDEAYIRPIFFAYLDIDGDPLRACTANQSITINGTGDTDLDGFTFDGIDPQFIDIGSVKERDGGSETVSCKLSGLVGVDDSLLALIGDPAKWQGRIARLWFIIRDRTNVDRGAITSYYTGYMIALSISGSPQSQTIEMSIESYLAAFSKASNRTYLDQELFDPGDLSARAAVAIANGVSSNPLIQNTGVGFGGSSGGSGYGAGSGGGFGNIGRGINE